MWNLLAAIVQLPDIYGRPPPPQKKPTLSNSFFYKSFHLDMHLWILKRLKQLQQQ